MRPRLQDNKIRKETYQILRNMTLCSADLQACKKIFSDCLKEGDIAPSLAKCISEGASIADAQYYIDVFKFSHINIGKLNIGKRHKSSSIKIINRQQFNKSMSSFLSSMLSYTDKKNEEHINRVKQELITCLENNNLPSQLKPYTELPDFDYLYRNKVAAYYPRLSDENVNSLKQRVMGMIGKDIFKRCLAHRVDNLTVAEIACEQGKALFVDLKECLINKKLPKYYQRLIKQEGKEAFLKLVQEKIDQYINYCSPAQDKRAKLDEESTESLQNDISCPPTFDQGDTAHSSYDVAWLLDDEAGKNISWADWMLDDETVANIFWMNWILDDEIAAQPVAETPNDEREAECLTKTPDDEINVQCMALMLAGEVDVLEIDDEAMAEEEMTDEDMDTSAFDRMNVVPFKITSATPNNEIQEVDASFVRDTFVNSLIKDFVPPLVRLPSPVRLSQSPFTTFAFRSEQTATPEMQQASKNEKGQSGPK